MPSSLLTPTSFLFVRNAGLDVSTALNQLNRSLEAYIDNSGVAENIYENHLARFLKPWET
ncbi:hypothetical protein IQ247_13150 [Plectonema cf. radiosum LEGE 06105]|uniref:Uncharacterized protein n=1 Tax=Plectonema cf. radiosum LEGE 06105 TaxID=945769 RepID=A0A8J7F2D3_9CYAN|nr:hypothetical protein [Plectonema radiosum]MBE9213602.1 hypothetical protein [Plectonema cf. radiosum LEGE 06105]